MSAYREDYTTPPVAPAPPPARVALPAVRPLVTYVIMGLTVFVYILQVAGQYLLGGDLMLVLGAKVNEYILAGEVWRLITPVLLHGSLLHIGVNMYSLLAIGAGLEGRMGHGRYLLLYLLGGFAGNALSFLLSSSISVGASTAIFGLLAAEGVFLYQNRKLLGPNANRALGNVALVAAANLFIGLSPGIDNWGHLGGLLGGLLFTWLGGPKWEVEGIYPDLRVIDRRETREVFIAAALVLAIFGGLTALGFFLK